MTPKPIQTARTLRQRKCCTTLHEVHLHQVGVLELLQGAVIIQQQRRELVNDNLKCQVRHKVKLLLSLLLVPVGRVEGLGV